MNFINQKSVGKTSHVDYNKITRPSGGQGRGVSLIYARRLYVRQVVADQLRLTPLPGFLGCPPRETNVK